MLAIMVIIIIEVNQTMSMIINPYHLILVGKVVFVL